MMRILTLFVLIVGSLSATAQDCDSDSIPDTAEFGPFASEPGGGLHLNGMPGVPSIDTLDYALSGQSFTIEMWVYRDTATGDQEFILTAGNLGVSNESIIIGFRADHRFVFGFWNNDLETAANYPPDGQWHHWMCRYDAATNFRWIFRDGVEVAFDTAPADFTGPMNTMFLGSLNASFILNGMIDELRVFDFVRPDIDVVNDINLQYTQSGIPAGLHAYYPLDTTNAGEDLAGNNSTTQGPSGSNAYIDYQPDCNSNNIPDECDTDCNANGIPDECDIMNGTSQDCNLNGIPDECDTDCNNNGIPDECDIINGTSQDCNNNGIPDECDIADGTSLDCNNNGVPDACDLADGTSQDCNNNGVPDECDLADGTSQDCNNNGFPDECDILNGTSLDCNGNGVPDGCDIDQGTSLDCNSNGIPDECDPDCNGNGLPDDCDILNATSTDTNGDGVPDECQNILNITNGTYWSTITRAIEHVSTGDTIELQPGTYTESFGPLSWSSGKQFVISSVDPDDQAIVDQTIINSFIRLTGATDILFDGIYLANGVRVAGDINTILRVARCRFDTELSSVFQAIYLEDGGTVYCSRSSFTGFSFATFIMETFSPKNASFVLIDQCVIANSDNAFFINNPFTQLDNHSINIHNSLLVNIDTAINGNFKSILSLNIANSILRGSAPLNLGGHANSTLVTTNSNISGGQGQIDLDPLFVDADGPDNDPLTYGDNDYRLMPDSPSVDTGLDSAVRPDVSDLDNDGDTTEHTPLDLDNNPRFVGTVDMGPYEYQGPPPCPADFTGEGNLDIFDILAFLDAFNSGDASADFTGEGDFDIFDILAFLDAFNAGCP